MIDKLPFKAVTFNVEELAGTLGEIHMLSYDVPSCKLQDPLFLDSPLFLFDLRISLLLEDLSVNANFSALTSGSLLRGCSNTVHLGGAHHVRFTVTTELSTSAFGMVFTP